MNKPVSLIAGDTTTLEAMAPPPPTMLYLSEHGGVFDSD